MTRKGFMASLLAAFATAIVAVPAVAGPIDEIVFFGDSISDTGNVWYATGGTVPPPPYNQGSSGAGPDFTGGQWSDPLGPSWSTVFADKFGLTATPSLVPGGNNYAWGGARTGVNSNPAGSLWLDQQVGLYALSGQAPTDTTLASIMIGGNDVANNLGDAAALVSGITSIVTQVTNLYALGVRQFLVANVPDIGATPTFRALGAATAAFATNWTIQWNNALATALELLALPGIDIDVLDLFALGNDPAILAQFENTTDPCFTGVSICADPGSYFYWDPFHPSSTAHSLIADAAAVAVPEPGTLALFGVGLLALGTLRRRRKV